MHALHHDEPRMCVCNAAERSVESVSRRPTELRNVRFAAYTKKRYGTMPSNGKASASAAKLRERRGEFEDRGYPERCEY
jgi:hypothetical protein